MPGLIVVLWMMAMRPGSSRRVLVEAQGWHQMRADGPVDKGRHQQAIEIADAVHPNPGTLLQVNVLWRDTPGDVEQRDKPAITLRIERFSQEERSGVCRCQR